MHGKVKKSKIISFIFVFILFIGLIAFTPLILNIKRLNGIGYYNFEGSSFIDYPEGRVGINVEVNIVHWQGDICDGFVTFHTISSGNITVHGITHIEYSIRADDSFYVIVDESVNPVAKNWNRPFRISLFKDNNVSCTGSSEVNYSIDSLEKTDVINFVISYIIPINVREIFYTWDIPLMWVNMFYVVLIFVVLSFVINIYKSLKFDYLYTDEMRDMDEEYFNYISQRKKKA